MQHKFSAWMIFQRDVGKLGTNSWASWGMVYHLLLDLTFTLVSHLSLLEVLVNMVGMTRPLIQSQIN